MRAPRRNSTEPIKRMLWAHPRIRNGLIEIQESTNNRIRRDFPAFPLEYKTQLADSLMMDLVAIALHDDWRFRFENTARKLKPAAKRIKEAMNLLEEAASVSPTWTMIPRVSLPTGLVEKWDLHRRRVFERNESVVQSLAAVASYCDKLTDQIGRILSARDRRLDCNAYILTFLEHVQGCTGKPNVSLVFEMLNAVREACPHLKAPKRTRGAIQKIRQRYLQTYLA